MSTSSPESFTAKITKKIPLEIKGTVCLQIFKELQAWKLRKITSDTENESKKGQIFIFLKLIMRGKSHNSHMSEISPLRILTSFHRFMA